MLELAIAYWPHLLGGAGAVAGLAAFAAQLLQIQKLKYEVDKLKKQDDKERRLVQLATPEEVEKFGRPEASLPTARRQVIVLSVMLMLIGPTLLLTRGGPDDQLSQPLSPGSEAAQPFAEAWLALLDSGNLGAAWKLMSPELRAQMSEQEFAANLQKSRPNSGLPFTRSLVAIASVDQQAGTPHKVFQFLTRAQDGTTVAEYITLSWRGGVLAISGYNVMPQS